MRINVINQSTFWLKVEQNNTRSQKRLYPSAISIPTDVTQNELDKLGLNPLTFYWGHNHLLYSSRQALNYHLANPLYFR